MKYINRAFERMKDNNWELMYIAIDVHGTIIKPTHNNDKHAFIFYPGAEDFLQYISSRHDIIMIMYTSSYPEYLDDFMGFLVDHNIYFDFINENPMVQSDNIADFRSKFYFDIMIDDKAGFDPETDWDRALISFKNHE